MTTLSDRQSAFADAILDPASSVPAGIIDPYGNACPSRFSVYRNNVVVGLIESLRDSYPAINRIVGDEFFTAMAREFALINPPRSPVMLAYGSGFADFIASFAPSSDLPYLRDVARIERAWIEAYHSPDAHPIALDALAELTPDELPNICLTIHPSARPIASLLPALTIWRMTLNGDAQFVDLSGVGEEILVCRPHWEVEVRQIPAGSTCFLEQLMSCSTVLAAAKATWASYPRFELGAVLRGLLDCGALVGWSSMPGETNSERGGEQNEH